MEVVLKAVHVGSLSPSGFLPVQSLAAVRLRVISANEAVVCITVPNGRFS
jgi:hypothetical protein